MLIGAVCLWGEWLRFSVVWFCFCAGFGIELVLMLRWGCLCIKWAVIVVWCAYCGCSCRFCLLVWCILVGCFVGWFSWMRVYWFIDSA